MHVLVMNSQRYITFECLRNNMETGSPDPSLTDPHENILLCLGLLFTQRSDVFQHMTTYVPIHMPCPAPLIGAPIPLPLEWMSPGENELEGLTNQSPQVDLHYNNPQRLKRTTV